MFSGSPYYAPGFPQQYSPSFYSAQQSPLSVPSYPYVSSTPLSSYELHPRAAGSYAPYTSTLETPRAFSSYTSFPGSTLSSYPPYATTLPSYISYPGLESSLGTPFASTSTFLSGFPTTTAEFTPLNAAAPPAPAPAPAVVSQKILVTGTAKLFAEAAPKAAAAIKTMQEESRRESGNTDFNWCIAIDDPTLVHIYEVWDDETALSTHLESEHVKVFKEVVPEIFVEDPRVQKATLGSAFEDI
jgi:quinol monooxygenase YgiN